MAQMRREVSGPPAWKAINTDGNVAVAASTADVPGDLLGQVMASVRKIDAARANPAAAQAEDEKNALASVIPTDVLREMATRYAVQATVTHEAESQPGDELDDMLRIADADGGKTDSTEDSMNTRRGEIAPAVSEPPKKESVTMPTAQVQDSPILSKEAVEKVASRVVEMLKPMLSKIAVEEPKAETPEIATEVVDPPKEEKVEEPKDEELQEEPVSEEMTKAARAKTAGTTVIPTPKGGATPSVSEPPKKEEVKMPADNTIQKEPITAELKMKLAASMLASGMSAVEVEKKLAALVDPVSTPPSVKEDVANPNDGKKDVEVVKPETSTGSPLPDAESVSEPRPKEQTSTVCAKFFPARPVDDSKWVIFDAKGPIFDVQLKQAHLRTGDDEIDMRNISDFVSDQYGMTLLEAVNTQGIRKAVYESFTDQATGQEFVTWHREVATKKTAAGATETPVAGGEVLVPPGGDGIVSPEGNEALNQPVELDKSILAGLSEALALLLQGKEEEDIEKFGEQLSDIVANKEEFGKLLGTVKEKIKDMSLGDERDEAPETLEESEAGAEDSVPGLSEEAAAAKEEEKPPVSAKFSALVKKLAEKGFVPEVAALLDKFGEQSEFVTKLKALVRTKEAALREATSQNEKWHKSEKERKARVLADAEMHRGMLTEENVQKRVAELVGKSDETLSAVAATLSKVPLRTARTVRAASEKVLTGLPVTQPPDSGILVTESRQAHLFSSPPEIDSQKGTVVTKGDNW